MEIPINIRYIIRNIQSEKQQHQCGTQGKYEARMYMQFTCLLIMKAIKNFRNIRIQKILH